MDVLPTPKAAIDPSDATTKQESCTGYTVESSVKVTFDCHCWVPFRSFLVICPSWIVMRPSLVLVSAGGMLRVGG